MRPPFGRTLLGGLIATLAFTVVLYFIAPWGVGHSMDIAKMIGGLLGVSWGVGLFIHFVLGVLVFAFIYGNAAYHGLPGASWAKGLFWGGILWFLAEAVFVPMVGGGFFHAHAGGFPAVFWSLIGHLAYGILLGAIAGRPLAYHVPEEHRVREHVPPIREPHHQRR